MEKNLIPKIVEKHIDRGSKLFSVFGGLIMSSLMILSASSRSCAVETSSADATGRIGYAELSDTWLSISFISELPHEIVAIQGLDRAFSITKTAGSKSLYFQRISKPTCSKSGCETSFRDETNDREFHFFDGRGLTSYRDKSGTKDIYEQKKWAAIFTGITDHRTIYVDLNQKQTGWTYRSFDFSKDDTKPSLSISSGSLVETDSEFIFSFHNADYSYRVIYQRPDRSEHPTSHIEIRRDDGQVHSVENCRMAVLRLKELMYWKTRLSNGAPR